MSIALMLDMFTKRVPLVAALAALGLASIAGCAARTGPEDDGVADDAGKSTRPSQKRVAPDASPAIAEAPDNLDGSTTTASDAPTGTGFGDAGSACTLDSDCNFVRAESQLVCSNTAGPDFHTCIVGCHADRDCPAPLRCTHTQPHWSCK